MGRLTRKEMLKLSGGTLAGASLLGLAGCGSGVSSGSSGGSKTLNPREHRVDREHRRRRT